MPGQDRKNPSGAYDGQSDDRSRGGPDRRDQGGMPLRPDDEALAERVEEERADEGVQNYNPDNVPAAAPEEDTDSSENPEAAEYEEEEAEVRRELAEGELTQDSNQPYPPTRYG